MFESGKAAAVGVRVAMVDMQPINHAFGYCVGPRAQDSSFQQGKTFQFTFLNFLKANVDGEHQRTFCHSTFFEGSDRVIYLLTSPSPDVEALLQTIRPNRFVVCQGVHQADGPGDRQR